MRCNNNGKLITNGSATKNITHYFTTYATKKQKGTYNLVALMTKGYLYHLSHREDAQDLRNSHRLLMIRLLNAISHEQELAAPMVMSYLMGWGDMYMSHRYALIKWTQFVLHLQNQWPSLVEGANE